jgi:outer membrane protein assembly factor BamB
MLFFGDRSVPARLFAYSTAFAQTWATGTAPNPFADGLNAPVVVDANYAFASPLSGDGQLHAINKGTGAEVWHWETGTTKSGNISAPSFGADAAIYFGTSSPAQLIPLKVVSSVPSLANNWSSSYKGSSSQNTAGVTGPPAVPATNTTVDGLPTEPVIAANGVLYFATGTSTAKVFALITDSGGPLAPVAGTTWPRVGFDNCNSSNTSFTCQ